MTHEPHSACSGDCIAERSQRPDRDDRMTGGARLSRARVDRLSDLQFQMDCHLVGNLNVSRPSPPRGDWRKLMRRCSAACEACIGKRALL
jgi:hypothetical protein